MKKLYIASAVILLVFMLSPMSMVQAKQTAPAASKTFLWDMFNFAPQSLDPASNYETTGGGMIQNIYEGFYMYINNSLSELQPQLATNYTISPDGTNYTFTLRTGVKYSDGTPFNAWTMAYSMERALIVNDQASGIWIDDSFVNGSTAFLGQSINATFVLKNLLDPNTMGIRVIDSTHVSIILNQGFGGFIQALQFPTFNAISPTAIIKNENSNYKVSKMQSDAAGAVMSLRSMFPTSYYNGQPGMGPNVDNATLLANLGLAASADIDNSGVVPQSDATGTYGYTWLNTHSAGTGAYMVSSLTQGVGATMVKNPNWWGTYNANAPDTIQIKQVAESATRILDLTTGQVDMADIDSDKLSQIFTWNPITKQANSLYPDTVQTVPFNSVVNGLIGMNQNASLTSAFPNQIVTASDSQFCHGTNTTSLLQYTWGLPNNGPINTVNSTQYTNCASNNPFTSVLFREAMAYAFDYNTFIQSALSGLGTRMSGVIPSGFLGHDPNLIANGNIPSFDLTIAKSLFQQVGWKGSITITYNTGSNGRAIAANLLKQAVEQLGVGITINIQNFAWSTFLTKVENNQLGMYVLGWAPDYADPTDYITPYYQGGVGTYAIASDYNNTWLNDMIDAAAVETNNTIRQGMYFNIEINATGDFPMIYLYQSIGVRIASTLVNNLQDPTTSSLNSMYNALWYSRLNLTAITTVTTTSTSASSSASTQSSPGFEILASLGLFAFAGFVVIQRRRKNV